MAARTLPLCYRSRFFINLVQFISQLFKFVGIEESSDVMESATDHRTGNETTYSVKPELDDDNDDDDLDINNLLTESDDFSPSKFMEVFVNESSGGLIDTELSLEKDDMQGSKEDSSILTPFSLNFADDMNVSYEGEHDEVHEEEKKGVCCVCGRVEGGEDASIKFHKFPRDLLFFKRWKEACHMKRSSSSLPVHQWRVCSKHFTVKDYFYRCGKSDLKAKAIPSLAMPNPPRKTSSLSLGHRQWKTCCICNIIDTMNSPITLHPFPVNQSLYNIWKERCGLGDLSDSGESWCVCSRHFTGGDFKIEKGQRRLHPLAVPSIWLKQNQTIPLAEDPTTLVTCILCKCRSDKFAKVSFHKFPSKSTVCMVWRKICNISETADVSKLRICSRHFSYSDVDYSLEGKRCLKVGALPLYNIPKLLGRPRKSFSNQAVPNRVYVVSNNVAQPQLSPSTFVENMKYSPTNQNNLKNMSSVQDPPLESAGNSITPLSFPELSGEVLNSQYIVINNEVVGNNSQDIAKTAVLSANANQCSSTLYSNIKSSRGVQYRLIYPKPPTSAVQPPAYISQESLPGCVPLTASTSRKATVRLDTNTTLSTACIPVPAPTSKLLTSVGTTATQQTKCSSPIQQTKCVSPIKQTKHIPLILRRSISKKVESATPKRPLSYEDLLLTVRQPTVRLERLVIPEEGKVVTTRKQGPHRGRYTRVKNKFAKYISDLKSDWKKKSQDKSSDSSQGKSVKAKTFPKKSGGNVDERKTDEDQLRNSKGKETGEASVSGTETDAGHTTGSESNTGCCFLCHWNGRRGDGNKVALYRFPSFPVLCQRWKRICGLKEGDDVSSLQICSKHFKNESFVQTKEKRHELTLTPWAYPSLAVPNLKAVAEIDEENTPRLETTVETPRRACFLCSYREGDDKVNSTTLYRFPNKGIETYQWKQACNVFEHDYMDTSSLFVCANHFSKADFTKEGGSKELALKPGAVPSVHVPNLVNLRKAARNVGAADSSTDSCDLSEEFDPADLMEVTLNEPDSPVVLTPPDEPLASPPRVALQSSRFLLSSLQGGLKKQIFVKQYCLKTQNSKFSWNRTLAPYKPRKNNKNNNNNEETVSQSVSNFVSTPNTSLNCKTLDKVPISSLPISSLQWSNKKNSAVVSRIVQTPGVMTMSSGSLQQYQTVPPQQYQTVPRHPPGLFVPTQKVKTFAHAGSQTLTTAILGDKMCQTISALNSSRDEIDAMLQPLAKRQRLSSPAETSLAGNVKNFPLKSLQGSQNIVEKESEILKKQLKSVQDLVTHLQQKGMLSQEAGDIITSTLTDEIQDLIASKLQSDGQGKLSADLRSFALTLHFFSIEAYNYVQNIWPNLLPDPSLIRNWFSVSDGKPGFTQEVLDDIYGKSKENGGSFPCCVFLCELPIRREVFFEDSQFYGTINLGTDQDMRQDGTFAAQTALVFFVSALHKSWCCPLGYFFISSLNGTERANLLTKCLDLLHEVYANVVSITIDGSPANISMCTCLGANFAFGEDLRPWFLDPVRQKKVLIFWDILKMLRLVRDTLGDKGCIFTQDDKIIKWSALKWLVTIQSKIHLGVFTHLTKKHVEYQYDRDNVLLCRQIFGQNVGKAFRLAREDQIEELRSANATDRFCTVFSHVLNMLSSENIFSRRECGSCITELSRHFLSKSAEGFVKYISSLKDANDVPILKSCRKTGFLGLVINLKNTFELFDVLSKVGVKQLLMSKLSHEYVELFSDTIRREVNGHLPNAKQFQDAYRKFVLKRAVRKIRLGPSTCLVDSIEMLHTASLKKWQKYPVRDFSDPICVGNFDCTFVSIVRVLSPLISVERYLYGLVIKKIISSGICSSCASHLTTEAYIAKILKSSVDCVFVEPSGSVMKICRRTDSVFQELTTLISRGQCTKEMFVNQVFMSVCWEAFSSREMDEHVLEQGYLDNHRSQLCKLIIETLFDIRVSCDNVKRGRCLT